MSELQETGVFRGEIVGYGLNAATGDSKAKAVWIQLRVDESFNQETREWDDWREYKMEVGGQLWVIKRDGSLNDRQVQSLCEVGGWDGDFTSIVVGTWQPLPIQVVVNEDTYNDDTRYRINWINEYDRVPGAGNVSVDDAKVLQEQYGPQLRALRGNATRNTKKPKGSPTKPAGPLGAAPAEVKDAKDDIPF